MKEFLSLCAGIGFLASGAVAQDAAPGSIEELMYYLASTNPLMHAIFADHIDEAKEVNAKFQASHEEAGFKAAHDMFRKYGQAAFLAASDGPAIEVLKRQAMSLMLWAIIIREGAWNSFQTISRPKLCLLLASMRPIGSIRRLSVLPMRTENFANRFRGWRSEICLRSISRIWE